MAATTSIRNISPMGPLEIAEWDNRVIDAGATVDVPSHIAERLLLQAEHFELDAPAKPARSAK